MTRRRSITGPAGAAIPVAILLGAASQAALGASPPPGPTWRWEVAAGVDASAHTYHLAVDDTTATISEALVQGALEGRSARGARHRWRCRGDLALGTELNRQRIDADYRLVDGIWTDRLRGDVTFTARQYESGSEYVYNSNNHDGRVEVRGSPLLMGSTALELRAHAAYHDYVVPSTLEVDDRRWGGAVFLRSPTTAETAWSAGVGALQRVYPDSSEIDREELGLELNYDSRGLENTGLILYHRSRKRDIADETVRPDAWSHWTDLRAALAAGTGRVILELQGEVWDYSYETDVWFDSWRLDGFGGYRGGNVLGTGWLLGLAAARLDAGDAPDTYNQYGLRGGLESYTGAVGGTLTLEVGRRLYDDGSLDLGDDVEATIDFYSDFTYWKIWLMGNWYISDAFSVEVLASYEPENHTEQADDTALGYFNLRCVWRP